MTRDKTTRAHNFRVQSQTNEEVTYKLARAYFCTGSSTWTENIENPVIRHSLSVLRHVLCDAEIELGELFEDLTGVVEGLTPSQKTDLYDCMEFRVHNVLQLIICDSDALRNYRSIFNYILYMIRCAKEDSQPCQYLVFLLENGDFVIKLARFIACNPSRQKRQFSLMSTMYMLDKLSCNTEDGLLLKFLDWVNYYEVEKFTDIYREKIEWDIINEAMPPFFCCAAKAAYAGFQQDDRS